jgi:hypothetical protein
MLPKTGKKLQTVEVELRGATDYASVIALALRREMNSSRHAVKTLMRWTGASERTVKNWLSARRGPSGQDLIALARHSTEVMQAFYVMAGRTELDDSTQFELKAILTRAIELLDMNSY